MNISFGAPFEEQLEFFKSKLNVPTQAWDDIRRSAHDHAFMSAGAMTEALLSDLNSMVEKAQTGEMGYKTFVKEFPNLVKKHGWEIKGDVKWRAKLIYKTNMKTAYAAGHYAQMTSPEYRKAVPLWRYIHSDDSLQPRAEHLAWDGLVLHHSDPWWQQHYPPQGFGCNCTVLPMNEDDLDKYGKTEPDQAPDNGTYSHVDSQGEVHTLPKGVDYGWYYAPGRTKNDMLSPFTPQERSDLAVLNARFGASKEPMPASRAFDEDRLLAPNLLRHEYATAFLAEFGATVDKPVAYQDVLGKPLAISASLFGRAGDLNKVDKRERNTYLLMLADTIKDPDEVWIIPETFQGNKVVIRRRYVANFTVGEARTPGVAVFEYGKNGWTGITTFHVSPKDGMTIDEYLQTVRRGVLVYRRNEKGEPN